MGIAIGATLLLLLSFNAVLILVIVGRQAAMTLGALLSRKSSIFAGVALHEWPSVVVLIPAHNEEQVIGGCLEAMCAFDYPRDRLRIVVIDDRSADATGAVADAMAARHPGLLEVVHRPHDARPGKPAALNEVASALDAEIFVVFDADYLPPPHLLKELVAPFVDPEVGATMGRVVPYNADVNTLTRLIDLERRSGYAVDQRMRNVWNLLPQFGGTVGGVRRSALQAVGGWRPGVLSEDTDLTYRLYLAGWRVEYLNHAVCYEEAPETWRARYRQVRRWSIGHNQCLFRYLGAVLRRPDRSPWRKIDATLMLLPYFVSTIALLSLPGALIYPIFFPFPPINLGYFSLLFLFTDVGRRTPFYQVFAATALDRQMTALRALPIVFLSSTINMIASTAGFFACMASLWRGEDRTWDKTSRFRRPGVSPAE
jgi:cellulose synthase/poly-beta-1,6-N-acetylglucosamine synthase-like glycosyltransferase